MSLYTGIPITVVSNPPKMPMPTDATSGRRREGEASRCCARRILSLVAAAAILGGCSAFHNTQQSASGSFHTNFRTPPAAAQSSPAAHSPGTHSGIDPERIGAYVSPYYSSTGPTVHVGRFSSGLASRNPSRVLATIETMKAHWQQLSFPELYVGAIRLYDLGYRNDSVYWFYTAQYRGRQFGAFLDPVKAGGIGDPGFELRSANAAFMQTAGTWINGYAFGNIDGLVAIIRRVQREGERQIPNVRAIYPHVAFIQRSAWPAANTELADGMNGFVAYLQQQRDAIEQQRAANGTQARFSHLTNKTLPR